MPMTDSLWLLRSPTLAFLGSIGGAVSGGLIWDFLYGIGSSVITDEFYSANVGTVRYWSAVAGGSSGFALGLLRDPLSAVGFVLVQFLSSVFGLLATPFG